MKTKVLPDQTRVNVFIDNRMLAGIKKIAALKGVSYSEIIRLACRAYIVSEGPRAMADHIAIKGMSRQ